MSDSFNFTFDNRFNRSLPADPEQENFRRRVQGACYSRVKPRRTSQPRLIAFSDGLAAQLDLNSAQCQSEDFTQVFSGNQLLQGMDPFAMCYGGHQFGNWAGQLGDGRAINLGEIVTKQGDYFSLQLKGSGETPYSRTADGLAVLRSSLREYLCSEAMHYLGVPTTRALSLMTTGDRVVRDMFYDGNPQEELGAVVCRVAPSFIRFGNFEILAAQGDIGTLRELCDFTIKYYFPHLVSGVTGQFPKTVYLDWFKEVLELSAEMVVQWMRVGFVHGVMNTDNMSILGLTIDYGPYGWLEDFDPNWTPNTTDAQNARYRFSHQPYIVHWNCYQLANALLPLIDDADALEGALNRYPEIYSAKWQMMMANKLGLMQFDNESDEAMVNDLDELLAEVETDMTIFFRQLSGLKLLEVDDFEQHFAQLEPAYYQDQSANFAYKEKLEAWLMRYKARLVGEAQDESLRHKAMKQHNPKYVLRNYIAQLAIDSVEEGDNTLLTELMTVLKAPYDEHRGAEKWYVRRPEWARERAGCSMLSCSS